MKYLFSTVVIAGCAYLYFYKGINGWWWVLAILLVCIAMDNESIISINFGDKD